MVRPVPVKRDEWPKVTQVTFGQRGARLFSSRSSSRQKWQKCPSASEPVREGFRVHGLWRTGGGVRPALRRYSRAFGTCPPCQRTLSAPIGTPRSGRPVAAQRDHWCSPAAASVPNQATRLRESDCRGGLRAAAAICHPCSLLPLRTVVR